ncbi:hypothetical protein [Tepidibacter aestuarii]|uniref:hypothetical protein n=1 Tax=Tepidibacter aestuarii TaxID=2925782 RepID=UPI0020BE0A01|nr:hypothetical protein [Tepidibacter aestuarii]CAH2214818.1 conserved protein of unknown function [Tepidibacter aestuarii]
MSELVWISVPGGKKNEVVLRVLIAPRLEGSSLVNDGMKHWPPPNLARATLNVEFAEVINGEIHKIQVPPLIQAESDVWEAFFGPNTIVSPSGRRQRSDNEVVVESTSTKAEEVYNTFDRVSKTPLRLNYGDDRLNLDKVVCNELKTRWSGEELIIPTPPPNIDEEEQCTKLPDFHQTIAMLREHPNVLKALGLIIELRIPFSKLPTDYTSGIVRVCWPDAPESLPKIVSPWTRYDKDFMPGSNPNIDAGLPPNIDAGLVSVDNSRWKVVTIDVDNAAKKLRDAAKSLADSTDSEGGQTDTKSFMMPALRTAGLMLIRCGRQDDFADRRRSANVNARNSMSDNVFYADDLVLGYRIDIREEGSNKWKSLHKRKADYEVNEKEIVKGVPEEGHTKAHAAILYGNRTLRADEVIACWRGWSFAVPQPRTDLSDNRLCPDMPFRFDWDFSVPEGTLPRLRFATGYQLRARVADIAGGGIKEDEQTVNRHFTDIVYYRRYEPVLSPELALPPNLKPTNLEPNKLSPGEAINQLVIRSDSEVDVSEFNTNAERLLYAPKTSLTLSEQHKALDLMTLEQIQELLKNALVNQNLNAPIHLDEILLPDVAAAGICVFPRSKPGGPNVTRMEKRYWSKWPDFRPMEIVLKERANEDSNIFEWEESSKPGIGDRLIVRLAKAEEVTLELSSFLKGDFFDHFAIFDHLPSIDTEDDRGAAVKQGRHPLVTPAQTVTLTHAVRRPLRKPGSFSFPEGERKPRIRSSNRLEGQTFAILDPIDLGVDSKSTAKLEITAKWTEPTNHVEVNVPVQSFTINRGEDRIKEGILHEFGDTRHRKITYTLNAVSRFKQFFKEQDEEAYVAQTELPISIPNSARPSPPVILATRPAFVWQEDYEEGPNIIKTRKRLGGILRIELKGPWYKTGEGEKLAVLVAKDQQSPKEEMWPFVTQAGSDMTRAGLGPERWPKATDFTFASGTPREVYLKEAGYEAIAVPHEPWFQDGRCFVDIAIPNLVSEAYMPFVRLAVARYQPESIQGLEVSTVVMTDMIQLLPERTLRVWREEDKVCVTLKGVGPYRLNEWIAQLEQLVTPPSIRHVPDADNLDLTLIDSIDSTELLYARPAVPAWVGIANQRYSSYIPELPPPHDKIKIKIPQGIKGPLRIRIQEKELYADEWTVPGGSDLDRTVYSDVVILPGT